MASKATFALNSALNVRRDLFMLNWFVWFYNYTSCSNFGE
jgi:hypothetical protein